MYSSRMQVVNQVVALAVIALFATALRINVGLPLAIIVGCSALGGFFCWRLTNLRRPIDPPRLVVMFLLTVAALHVHMYEEHTQLFGPAMSRLFAIPFPDDKFLLIFVFVLPTLYYLTAIGLLLRVPLAAFVAWFIFIGPGIAELTHFIFPLLEPAVQAATPGPVTAAIQGTTIAGMVNHYVGITGVYYFPGLYTAVLPMIPGIYSVCWLFSKSGTADTESVHAPAVATA
jgi:hypothetical protein